jgi:hypothetical protein
MESEQTGNLKKKKKRKRLTPNQLRKIRSAAGKRNWENPEYRAKIVAAVTERSRRPEWRQHMSEYAKTHNTINHRGWRPWNKGKKGTLVHTPETKERLSQIVKERMRQHPKYRKLLEDMHKKSVAVMKEKWKDPAFRRKMRRALRKGWRDKREKKGNGK